MTPMTAIIETVLHDQSAPDLAALRSNYDAIQQHKADVDERYNVARADLQEKIQTLETAWQQSYAELIAEWQEVGENADLQELALRQSIIAAYRESGQKQLGHGLSVQVRSKYIYDEAKAVEWAAVNAPICVRRAIDAKAFEAICKNNLPEFVTVKETPVAVIKN